MYSNRKESALSTPFCTLSSGTYQIQGASVTKQAFAAWRHNYLVNLIISHNQAYNTLLSLDSKTFDQSQETNEAASCKMKSNTSCLCLVCLCHGNMDACTNYQHATSVMFITSHSYDTITVPADSSSQLKHATRDSLTIKGQLLDMMGCNSM